jgi:hypothetical protein
LSARERKTTALSRLAALEGLAARSIAVLGRHRGGALLFCVLAALCSTWLSGINFPEQNNRWQIPVVLDFAGSAEGPHDAYSRSFANFISLFWIAVRGFTNESNIEAVFVAIQLAGNALLASAIFTLIRQAGNRPWPAAFVTGFLCFCYGLWGATPLGYSEIFVTYATHTQYAIALCLFGLALIMGNRPYLAAILFGIAANINLFMAVWGGLTAGCALVVIQRRIVTREQLGFSLLFLAIAAPVTLWGLSAGESGGGIPAAFFRDFLAGHVYGFDYPRALTQSFALLLAAGLATCAAFSNEAGQRLGIVMLVATAVLAAAAAMPYLTDASLLLLLHPLRFTSIPVVLAAGCAGALFLAALRGPADGSPYAPPLFAAALALSGFALKLPVVILFGFALAVPRDYPRTRAVALLLSAACSLALFLPAPDAAAPGKAALALLMMCGILAAVALLRPESAPLPLRLTAAALGGVATLPLSPVIGVSVLLATAAAILCAVPRRPHAAGAVAAAAAAALMLWTVRDDPAALAMMGLGVLLLAFAPMLRTIAIVPPLARVGLFALVPLLMVAGLANGARHGFAPTPTAEQRDFMAAQRWARVHMPQSANVLPIGVADDFSLFSRRSVWWEQSQGAAVLWQPSFLPLWSDRRAALDAASTPQKIVALARREGIDYLVVRSSEAPTFGDLAPAYANAHFTILGVVRP